jgi:hypothetical protein
MEFISHCVKKDPNKLAGRATSGMLIMLVVLSLLGWIYLTQASQVATTGRRIEALQGEKARLEQQNMDLTVEVATLESVERLMAEAQKMGFSPVALGSAEYVEAAGPEAVQAPQAVYIEGEEPLDEPAKSASWLDSVAAQFYEWARSDVP